MRWLSIFFCFQSIYVYSQGLIVKPQYPVENSTLTFTYHPPLFFSQHTKLKCITYFSGIDSVKPKHFPKAIDVPIIRAGENWMGEIKAIPENATSFVVVFMDTLGRKDNNEGLGYWQPIYKEGAIKPGALAGVGDLLYGNWYTKESPFHIGQNLDSANKFFRRDFSKNPHVKRTYMRQYLQSLKLTTEEEEASFKNELTLFSKQPNLSEAELLVLMNNYSRLNDTTNARICESKIFNDFPEGSWTIQSQSLRLLIEIGSSKNLEKQKKLYKEFKEKYLREFPDEFTNRVMRNRAARMLSYMVTAIANEGKIDLWMDEVNKLPREFRCYAYQEAVWELLGTNGRGERVNSHKQTGSLESTLIDYPIDLFTGKSELARIISSKLIATWQESMIDPRTWNEPPILTDQEVKNYRQARLAEFLALLGESYLNLNRVDEAVNELSKAVWLNGYSEPSINEIYIKSLMKNADYEKAQIQIEKIILLEKSTPAINSLDKRISDRTGRPESQDSWKQKLKESLINENAPHFSFYDKQGKKQSITIGKGKIIVIDFWASWCPPCMVALKAMDQVIDKYKTNSSVLFLLVNEDQDKAKATKVIEQQNNKLPFVFDFNKEIVRKLGVTGLPTQIIIDRQGKIRFRRSGISTFNTEQTTLEIEAMLELLN